MINRYIVADLWDILWPNMFAPSLITLAAIMISHMLHRRAMATRIDKLHDRLDKIISQNSKGSHEREK